LKQKDYKFNFSPQR